MARPLSKCRLCGSEALSTVLELGQQALTGHFPAPGENVPMEPLTLVRCEEGGHAKGCGLLQLGHSFDLSVLYGEHYGYRSSLNASMVRHLEGLVRWVEEVGRPAAGDLVIDVGSNDGTLLKHYAGKGLRLVGCDPTIAKFGAMYPPHIAKVSDFFPSAELDRTLGSARAKVVTSVAMFYDLEDPLAFAKAVHDRLEPGGVWLLEQSYMPEMVALTSYDTICHEHIEYYGARQLQWVLERAGLKVLDCKRTDANGGSLVLLAVHADDPRPASAKFRELCADEAEKGFAENRVYQRFAEATAKHRTDLQAKVADLRRQGCTVWGYGASTKGNVLLQYCGFDAKQIKAIFEVNSDKYGKVTPGTAIPIVPERLDSLGPKDVLLVLPWHFRAFFEKKLAPVTSRGVRLLFPLGTEPGA